MSSLSIRTLTGTTTIDADTMEGLAGELRGTLVTRDSPDYDEIRAVWNGMIDRRPAVIVRCTETADVVAAVRFARANDLLVCVRGGGHHIAGNAVADDAFMIDLQAMSSVDVDAAASTAIIGPGATLGDVDRATQPHGLALPVGINSTTGIAGLSLGGGFGWLTPKYGMTVDHLIGADVVTADGELVRASAGENTDLFWAIRGGGGNFGIVASFEFRLRAVGPEVLAGLIVYPFDDAAGTLRGYRDALASASEELCVWTVLRKAPPLPFLPDEVHGTEVVVVALVHIGDAEQADADVAPFMSLGTPAGTQVGRMPFADFQTAFDPLLEPGARNYWKSHDLATLDDGLIDEMVGAAGELPSPECEVLIGQLGGAAGRVAVEDTAYPGREAGFVMNVHGRWRQDADDEACIGWSRRLFDAATPFALGTAYVNFMTADEAERLQTAYGRNFERLLSIKAKYDSDNFFRINPNLNPSAAAEA